MTSKEIIKSWFNFIDEKNYEGIKGHMAADHQFHNPMTPAPLNADEHIGMIQMMTSSFEGEHILDLLVEEDNHVAVKGRWSGKHVGDFEGVPATGNNVEFSWTDVFQIVDGKVKKEHMELNPMSIMQQIAPQQSQNN